jgi:DNA-directed RNA polymerase specialized sigma subunit
MLGGLTQSRMGARLGYSQMHISRLLRRATAELHVAAARHSQIRGRSAA